MRRCWACSRRRPMRCLRWVHGEPAMCSDEERASCRRAAHRDEARVCRWILGDHDEDQRPMWRRILAKHLAHVTAR